MLDILVVATAAILSWRIWHRTGTVTPALALTVTFGGAFLVRASGIVPVTILTVTACLLVVLGLATVAAGHLAFVGTPQSRRFFDRPKERHFAAVAFMVLALSLIGHVGFRQNAISLSDVGVFGDLSPAQIRATDLMQSSNLSVYLASSYPVLAVVGVTGYRFFHRAWLILTFAAVLLAAAGGSNRTYPFMVALAAAAALLLTRATVRRSRIAAIVFALLGGVVLLWVALQYFNSVGAGLDKLESGLTPSVSWIPQEYMSALVYVTGGPSALGEAISTGVNPWAMTPGWSYQVVRQVVSVLGLAPPVGNLDVSYVYIPGPFNMYTGFGDVFFDIGVVGLAAYGILMGALSALLTRLWIHRTFTGLFGVSYGVALYAQFYFSDSIMLSSAALTASIGFGAFGYLDYRVRRVRRTANVQAKPSGGLSHQARIRQ